MAHKKKVHLIAHPGTYKGRNWGKSIPSVCGKPLPAKQVKRDRYETNAQALIGDTTCLSCLRIQQSRDQEFIDMMMRIANSRVEQRCFTEGRYWDLKEGRFTAVPNRDTP